MQTTYKREITYKDVPGYEYGIVENALKSDSPAESCYCVNKTRDVNGNPSCYLDGVMDLHPCLGKKKLFNVFKMNQNY